MQPNNNTHTNACVAVITTRAIARAELVHLMNADWAPGGRQPSDQDDQLWLSPLVGCYYSHPPFPFVDITQPKSWYLFCHPTKGGRLSQPKHCRKGSQPVPNAVHCSGCRDKHNCPWPVTLLPAMLPLSHCDLQRQMSVNNLPKVVTGQCSGQELNSQPLSCESSALNSGPLSHPWIWYRDSVGKTVVKKSIIFSVIWIW